MKQPTPTHLIMNTPCSASLSTPAPACRGSERPKRLPGLLAGFLLVGSVVSQAATLTWTNAAGDLNWSTSANWSPNTVPGRVDTARFPSSSATNSPGEVNNIVDGDRLIALLEYRNNDGAYSHNTRIPDGVTLTLTNTPTGYALRAYGLDTQLPENTRLTNIISGARGAVTILSPGAYLGVEAGGNPGVTCILDMSDLGTFDAFVTRLYVGGTGGTTATAGKDQQSGLLKLARTNIIRSSWGTANARGILVGYNHRAPADGGTLELGQTNAIFSDMGMDVGMRRATNSVLCFGPGFVNPAAYFRNRTGGRQSLWNIGHAAEQNYMTGYYAQGTVDFTRGTVDALVDQMVIGRSSPPTYDTGAKGFLRLTAGTIDVNTVVSGDQWNDASPAATGQVDVGGLGQLIVNSSWQLGNFKVPKSGDELSSAVLNVGTIGGGGGLVTVNGPITTTRDPSNPGSSSEIHVANGGSLHVKGTVGPLSVLELNHAMLTLDYGNAAPTLTPVCITSNLITAPSSSLTVAGTAFPSIGQFPLIQYESIGAGSGFSDIQFTKPDVVQGYFTNNVANKSFDLVITNVLVTTWTGQTNGVNVGHWDIGVTRNWKDQNGVAHTYEQAGTLGNAVIFDDSAPGTTTVHLEADALSPISITVNNASLAYTFAGSGGLTGMTSLNKDGSGILTIGNGGLNDFTGPVVVNGGTLQLSGSADRLPTRASVTLAEASGVLLDLNNQNQTLSAVSGGPSSGIKLGSGTLTLSGGGATFDGVISGSGRLVKTNVGVSATQTLTGDNTYSGGTLISGVTTLLVANVNGSGLGTGDVVIENGGTLQIGNGGSGSIAAAAITNNGNLVFNVNTAELTVGAVISGSGSVTMNNTGLARLANANSYAGVTTLLDGQVRVSNDAALGTAASGTLIASAGTARLEFEGGISAAEPLEILSKHTAVPCLLNVSETNTLTGPILLTSGGSTLPQDWVFRSDAGKLELRGLIQNAAGGNRHYYLRGDGDGEIERGIPGTAGVNNLYKYDGGTWTLWGDSSHAGTTTVQGGKLVVNGTILKSTGITVNSDATLAGSGLIACAVTSGPGSFLSPGSSSIGTLTISNQLVLEGTTLFEVGNNTCDQIRGLTNVVFGGTLQVVVAGTLYGVEAFKLFDADSYSGTFAALDLPTLPAPFAWDTTALESQGILRVTGGVKVATAGFTGGQMQLAGAGPANATYRVLATTNVALPSSQWTEVGNGSFAAGDGAFTFTDPNTAGFAQRYYRVVTP